MPAPVAVSSTSAQPHPRSKGQARKTRVVKRRGRVAGDIASDEEIEREARSDSDSDEQSSLGSHSHFDSDSEAEDATHHRVVTPSTTQSPPPRESDELKPAELADATGPFHHGTVDWSEMVANEDARGSADLPVIDFADLGSHQVSPPPPAPAARTRKAQPKPGNKAAPSSAATPAAGHEHVPPAVAASEEAEDDGRDETPVASSSVDASSREPAQRRPSGQTARQAYQQRLEKDPSYVPVVGEFWGHDDRLLDKDLRSLSGWWRGRWQGGVRGRGGFGMRGRGRAGYFAGSGGPRPDQAEEEATQDGDGEAGPAVEVPPIERPWTHDGFEEMRRRDDQRRPQQPQATSPTRGGYAGFRGARGTFAAAPRGRGAFPRGGPGFTPQPPRPAGHPSASPTATTASTRVWFAMKPERTWTKQHEGFLHLDPAMKARPGLGQGFKIRLPGTQGHIVRAPPRASAPPVVVSSQPTASASMVFEDPKAFTVRLPGKGKSKATVIAAPDDVIVQELGVTGAEPPFANDQAARATSANVPAFVPEPAPVVIIALPAAAASAGSSTTAHRTTLEANLSAVAQEVVSSFSSPLSQNIEQEDLPSATWVDTQNPVATSSTPDLPSVLTGDSPSQQRPPPPPPLAIPVFQPPPAAQPSPPYGSPYVYQPQLPPGIAISQHGMPYEIATGRPVYLPPNPPPPQMYTPQPVMHSHMGPPSGMPFVPGHMHHPSSMAASPDFLSPHSRGSSIAAFMDPSTGRPIFTPPRQSSRIEIRAPSDDKDGKGLLAKAQPSGLRTAHVAPEDMGGLGGSAMSPDADGRLHAQQQQQAQMHHMVDPVMMYAPYPQQYYYPPEQYGYAQSPYVDLSQMPGYEMYPPPDQMAGQPAVYY